MPTREQVMSIAAAEIGYRDNSGARYWNAVYPPWVGGAFCAAFEVYCFKKAGSTRYPSPGITGAFYTPTMLAAAKANGTYRAPTIANASTMKYGDGVLYDWEPGTGADHTSFFEKYLGGGWFQTIESNTSSGTKGSQSNGRGTWRRQRHIRDVIAFLDYSYLYDDAKPQTLTGLDERTTKLLQMALGVEADGIIGQKTIAALQHRMGTPADGIISGPSSSLVEALQRYLNSIRTGILKGGKKVQPEWEDLAVDGVWGDRSARAVTTYLTKWRGAFTTGRK